MTLNGRRNVVLGGNSGTGLAVAQVATWKGAAVVNVSSQQAKVDAALGLMHYAKEHAMDLSEATSI